MHVLGIDIGSSSVKCAVLRGSTVPGGIVHARFSSQIDGVRVEVAPDALLKAVHAAVKDAGSGAKSADVLALSVMSPAWVAMDAKGRALTPFVTHQDRRSVEVARELEQKVGKERYLALAGNRPFPGGISATTWAWYLRNEPARLRKADLAGHLNTFLLRQFTGARVIDPANASFTGLYSTPDQGGWKDELCEAVGAKRSQLPEVREAGEVAGRLTREAAGRLGLKAGMPVLVGIVDTSSAMLLTGAKPGQLLNSSGSTDVLGLSTNRAAPHERLLTRALGVGRKWMSVSTLAAAGSAIAWTKDQLFADLDWPAYTRLIKTLSRKAPTTGKRARGRTNQDDPAAGVRFEPFLAGDRTSIEQSKATFTGLTLATTRNHMLAAVLEALAHASAARLGLLKKANKIPLRHEVVVTGGAGELTSLFHRDWPGKWSFRSEKEATLRGLACLEPRERS
ncbi:MAG TPA: FGGY family carbohydrate kinase [Tepidisphaeraceae bacterium]|jgi:xylulokinase|nr:FGGY family carbohydrate kinase [Tepidisphaeraceae bacterium]